MIKENRVKKALRENRKCAGIRLTVPCPGLVEMMGMVDSLQVEEHDLLISDDHAVVLNDWHIVKGDRDERVNHVVIYHTDGDKISEIWVVAENQAVMDELMSG